MTLREYLKSHREGPTHFAIRADLSRSTVQRVLRGQWCGLQAMTKIVKATDGQVTPSDLASGVSLERVLAE
jgi:predicted transcriptional regulator